MFPPNPPEGAQFVIENTATLFVYTGGKWRPDPDSLIMRVDHDVAGDTWSALGHTWTDGDAARRFQQTWLALRQAYPAVVFELDQDAQIIAWDGDEQPSAAKVAALGAVWGKA